MAKTMTIQDLRNMVDGHDGEDRISTLPDELIHQIFSFLDATVAVKTCVLSKRWVNIWTTLPYVDFQFHPFDDVKWCKFISQFLLKRNPDTDTNRVRVKKDCLNVTASRQIIDYAMSHNVKHLYLNGYYLYMDCNYKHHELSFPALETLHLSYFNQPLEYWSMPSLTILHLEGDLKYYCEKALSFEGLYNLKELTLLQCNQICNMDDEISNMDDLMIKSPNLECLTIYWLDELYPMCKFVISAPKLSSFKFSGKYMPVLSAEGGFPCLKEVDFDLYSCQENINNKLMEKFDCLFCEFRGIKLLALSRGMIQVLMQYSERWPCPFANLKTLLVRGSNKNNSRVINYLLNSSPGVKISIGGDGGHITNYNSEEDMLLDSAYPVVKSNKQMARSIPVKAAVLRRVIGLSYCNGVSFSLWEGHCVYPEYLMLLRYIKEKQPQTFEHFASRKDSTVYTVGLYTLCSSIKTLSEVYSFSASTISYFRTLFTDLEIWGFNTTWLVNILDNISETPADLING